MPRSKLGRSPLDCYAAGVFGPCLPCGLCLNLDPGTDLSTDPASPSGGPAENSSWVTVSPTGLPCLARLLRARLRNALPRPLQNERRRQHLTTLSLTLPHLRWPLNPSPHPYSQLFPEQQLGLHWPQPWGILLCPSQFLRVGMPAGQASCPTCSGPGCIIINMGSSVGIPLMRKPWTPMWFSLRGRSPMPPSA